MSVMTNCGSLVLEPSYNVTRFKSTISHKNTSNKYKQYKIHLRKQLAWLNFSLTIKKYSSSATPGLLKKRRKKEKKQHIVWKYININKYLASLQRRS